MVPISASNVAKKDALVDCTMNSNESIENSFVNISKERTVSISNKSDENVLVDVSKNENTYISTKSPEFVCCSSSYISLEDTNANSITVLKDPVKSSTLDPKDRNSIQLIESSETNDNCTSTTEWNKSVLDSTTEKADCDSTTTSKDPFCVSNEGTSTSDSSNDEPRRKRNAFLINS
jgi:hypothetical protein